LIARPERFELPTNWFEAAQGGKRTKIAEIRVEYIQQLSN
jgi:hypothetical protein